MVWGGSLVFLWDHTRRARSAKPVLQLDCAIALDGGARSRESRYHAASNLNVHYQPGWDPTPDTWKHAQIRLKSDSTKCLTVKATTAYPELILDKCGGGKGGGHRLSTQQFTYKFYRYTDGFLSPPFGQILNEHPGDTDEAAVSLDMGWCGSKSPEFPCPMILWWSEKKSNEKWIWDDTFRGHGRIVTRYDADDDENKEELCMQPKNNYFGSKIVAGKCKHGDSKQHWEIVGEKVRHNKS